MAEIKPKSKIFVDGNCIVCDMEVAHYKKIAPESFDIVDIAAPGFDAAAYGLTPEAVQAHMHLLTPEGKVLTGIEAFIHIWNQIPKYHWAARAIRWPGVYTLSLIAYDVFAKYRYLLPKRKRN